MAIFGGIELQAGVEHPADAGLNVDTCSPMQERQPDGHLWRHYATGWRWWRAADSHRRARGVHQLPGRQGCARPRGACLVRAELSMCRFLLMRIATAVL